jgi:hypothetical protein
VARLLPHYHYVCTRHRYWIGPPDVGQGVEPRDAGTAGALNNVSQQLGSVLGVALISTFVATATNHYLTQHGSTAVVGATVHGSPSATGGPQAYSGRAPSSAVP